MASAPLLLRAEESKAGDIALQMPGTKQASSSKERIEQVFASHAPTALKLRTSTAKERIVKIKKLQDALLKNREALYEAAYADFKKPAGEVDLAELTPVMLEANAAIRNLKSWMSAKRAPNTLLIGIGTNSRVQASLPPSTSSVPCLHSYSYSYSCL